MNDIEEESPDLKSRLLGAKKEKQFGFVDVVFIVLIAVILCFSIVQRYWLTPVEISGRSMNRTIDDGDWLLMNKFAKPTYGDVVIIEISGETNYIKRVIGMEGDALYMQDGVVYRKKAGETAFTALDEPYAYYSRDKKDMNMPVVIVKEGCIFFLGDNRCDSRDSRQIGAKSVNDVLGVVPDWVIENRKSITSYYTAVLKVDNFILSLFNPGACGGRNTR